MRTQRQRLTRRKLRLLQQIADRQRRRLPAPKLDYFSNAALKLSRQMTNDGLLALTKRLGIRLTPAGRRFIVAHGAANSARHKTAVHAHPKAKRQPQVPGHCTPTKLPASFTIIAGPGRAMAVP